jgi:hypothetical protein
VWYLFLRPWSNAIHGHPLFWDPKSRLTVRIWSEVAASIVNECISFKAEQNDSLPRTESRRSPGRDIAWISYSPEIQQSKWT